jgi:VanZ family protein
MHEGGYFFMKWIFRILPLIYMALVWIQSSFAADHFVKLPDSTLDQNIKESLHLIEFAILYVLLVLAFLTRRSGFTNYVNAVCALLAALWGVTDEIHQSFVPYRSASLFDFVKDMIGISVCFYFVRGALFGGRFGWLDKVLRRIRQLSG